MMDGADSARWQCPGWMVDYTRPTPSKMSKEADGITSMQRISKAVDDLLVTHQPQSSDRKRRRRYWSHGLEIYNISLILVFMLLVEAGTCVRIQFDSCFETNLKNQLQFVPIYFDASFIPGNSTHFMNATIYGNVTGSTSSDPLPPPSDPSWGDNSVELGKIVNVSDPTGVKRITALTSRFRVLTYTPYEQTTAFCDSVLNSGCPMLPIFNANETDPSKLDAFSVEHNFNSSYAFTTFSTTFTVQGGGASALKLACISANITPDLGKPVANLLTYVPLAILIISGIATAFAGVFSPWGSSDTFKWTSNYGRDEDLLRLVTPGFGDCLQYLQFIVLTGSLSLQYPGFYQPAVSQSSWSSLMFNTSFVSRGNGTRSLQDGIYAVSATYGLDRMSQYVGMSQVDDIWAGMMVWLLVILLAVVTFIQAGFLVRWLYRLISDIPEEDLRAKNMPFSVGNVIRIVFNYFLLPIVALSMFQLVVASRSPAYVVALAVVVLVVLIGFSAWLLRVVATTRPRSHLFDDLPTVLLYGPLYNTYSDNAAAFAMVPVLLNIIRGIAIGAVQPSGVAQIVLLAICEVVFILTLHAFRPFHSPTSMNAYHTFFAIIRLLTTLLSIAFVPSLGVTEAPRGWIGYVILLMHGIALVFGFLLNSIQTFAEVGARLAGAGGEAGGATRGGLVKVFGMRQLSRRLPRMQNPRHSTLSGTGTLSPDDARKSQLNGRSRSQSGSSAKLLGRAGATDSRLSGGLDSMSGGNHGQLQRDSGSGPFTPSTPGAASTFSAAAAAAGGQGGILGISTVETATPFYRPPRARRPTVDAFSPAARNRGSWASGDWANKRWSHTSGSPGDQLDAGEGPSISGRETPVPPHISSQQPLSDMSVNEPRSNTDYAVREVDFYYGVRGPALSTLPTRRLGTGPADPTGPVASAAGWFKGLFGGKTKEKGKGFEVVRSSRMPPAMMAAKISGSNSPDNPESDPAKGTARGLAIDTGAPLHTPDSDEVSPLEENDSLDHGISDDADLSDEEGTANHRHSQISPLPPSLPSIDAGGGIELPSRIGSKASSKKSTAPSIRIPGLPYVKRKSSKRKPEAITSRGDPVSSQSESRRLSTIMSPPRTPAIPQNSGTASPSRMPFAPPSSDTPDNRQSTGAESMDSAVNSHFLDGTSDRGHRRDSSGTSGINAAFVEDDRPTSLGYVQTHRAGDNIHRLNAADRARIDAQGSAAEVVSNASRTVASTHREPLE